MRPTTKDLARAAGVSLATVDRVLNDRPGVRAGTIERVNQAIRELGFVRDISAANLARKRDYRFLFVLPDTEGRFMSGVVGRIDEANRAFALERVHADVLRIPETDAHAIAAVLDGLEAGAGTGAVDGVAIMAPASPQVRDAIDRLRRRGVSVVAFISKQPNAERSRFIGIDNRAAGRTAARLMGRFCGPGAAGALLVVCETMQLLDNLERRLGFDQVINGVFPDLSVSPSLETWGDPERTRATLAQALANAPDLRGVYVMSSEADRVLDPLAEMVDLSRLVIVAHERTDYTEAALRAGAADAVITQDSGHLVRSALRVLRASVDARDPLESQETVRIEILVQDNL
ncbi:MAG: LacI family transcriptional regulator [Rhodobacteraceae bacterium]|nr:LacI family transcriptional regulator [Paracoccaceae bacterium]MBR25437.1 LacI family transcriptional regulator [Paracoccaceae bacterium]